MELILGLYRISKYMYMRRDQNIICFGFSGLNSIWYSDKYTMRELAPQNKILYIEPSLSLLSPLRNPEFMKRWKTYPFRLKKMSENFYVMSYPPIMLPFPYLISLIPKITSNILALIIKWGTKVLNFNNVIIWSFFHHYEGYHIVNRLKKKLLIYDCLDEYSSYTDHTKSKIYLKSIDRWMCKLADVVFTVSENLLKDKKRLNKNTFLIPNAVDLRRFQSSTISNIPEDIKHIKPPIIGLIGLIDFQMSTDMELLIYIAQNRPKWSIVLIGPVDQKPDKRLLSMRNIHFLGPKRFEELPAYIKKFDVCIMPYLINEFTKYNYPQKLFEYLAAGRPVVTTNIPSVENLKDIIKVSCDYQDFLLNIETSLNENDIQKVKQRVNFAMQNTWDKRVAQKAKIVEDMMQ